MCDGLRTSWRWSSSSVYIVDVVGWGQRRRSWAWLVCLVYQSYLIVIWPFSPNNSARHLQDLLVCQRGLASLPWGCGLFSSVPSTRRYWTMSSSPTIYYGPVINPETLTSYKALPNCLFSVGVSGNIDWIVEDVAEHALQDTLAQKGCIDLNVTTLRTGEFFVPGFIDTHTVSNIGHWNSGLLICVD